MSDFSRLNTRLWLETFLDELATTDRFERWESNEENLEAMALSPLKYDSIGASSTLL